MIYIYGYGTKGKIAKPDASLDDMAIYKGFRSWDVTNSIHKHESGNTMRIVLKLS